MESQRTFEKELTDEADTTYQEQQERALGYLGSHCPELRECLADLRSTPCGADPCEVVKEALLSREIGEQIAAEAMADAGVEKKPDHRMEAIRAWATVVQQSLMMQGPDFAGEVGYLSRIIELTKEADE